MKLSHFIKNRALQTLFTCYLSISATAQLRQPENVPINFYGKVIDQNGNPISGAKVSVNVVISHFDENRTEQQPVATETAQNGDFTITGVTGHGIDGISIQDHGYELSQKTKRGYVFTITPDYTPDLRHPIIFKMWKHQHPDNQIHITWSNRIKCDGSNVTFNLLKDLKRSDGNLRIACSQIATGTKRGGRNLFDYKMQVSIEGGLIQSTEDEFMYLAPESGYTPSVTIESKASDARQSGDIKRQFYIKTASGNYGRLTVDWYAWQVSPTHLEWESYINPIGSRNLEFDKLADLRKHVGHPEMLPPSDYP